MKNFFIFYIIFVSIMSFMLTRPKTVRVEGHIVTQEEADNYKKKLIEQYNVPKEKAEDYTNFYVESRTTEPYEKTIEGKSFINSLLFSSLIYIIGYGIIFVIFHTKNAYYRELFGSHKNDSLGGWRRFFF